METRQGGIKKEKVDDADAGGSCNNGSDTSGDNGTVDYDLEIKKMKLQKLQAATEYYNEAKERLRTATVSDVQSFTDSIDSKR